MSRRRIESWNATEVIDGIWVAPFPGDWLRELHWRFHLVGLCAPNLYEKTAPIEQIFPGVKVKRFFIIGRDPLLAGDRQALDQAACVVAAARQRGERILLCDGTGRGEAIAVAAAAVRVAAGDSGRRALAKLQRLVGPISVHDAVVRHICTLGAL